MPNRPQIVSAVGYSNSEGVDICDTTEVNTGAAETTYTDRDTIAIRRRVAELEGIVADTLSPPIRHAREQHELARLRAALDAHAHGKEPAAP